MRDPAPPRRGPPPRATPRPFVPPIVRLIDFNPRLPMEPGIAAPEATMPVANFGVPDGLLGSFSSGPGRCCAVGEGEGGGAGNRKGPGAGDGEPGPGISGRTRIRGTILVPVLLSQIEPEYTEEARIARHEGIVVLQADISPEGVAGNFELLRSLGLGLDEKAVEAVRRWEFKPARAGKKKVPFRAVLEIHFRLL